LAGASLTPLDCVTTALIGPEFFKAEMVGTDLVVNFMSEPTCHLFVLDNPFFNFSSEFSGVPPSFGTGPFQFPDEDDPPDPLELLDFLEDTTGNFAGVIVNGFMSHTPGFLLTGFGSTVLNLRIFVGIGEAFVAGFWDEKELLPTPMIREDPLYVPFLRLDFGGVAVIILGPVLPDTEKDDFPVES
jgi:hypothetical protein